MVLFFKKELLPSLRGIAAGHTQAAKSGVGGGDDDFGGFGVIARLTTDPIVADAALDKGGFDGRGALAGERWVGGFFPRVYEAADGQDGVAGAPCGSDGVHGAGVAAVEGGGEGVRGACGEEDGGFALVVAGIVRGGWGGPGERGSERGQAEDFQNASDG